MRGRPKLPDEERKHAELRIRLTEEDRATLDRAAQNEEQETSTWARHHLLKIAEKRVPKPIK